MTCCHSCGGLYTACRCITPTDTPISPDVRAIASIWLGTTHGVVFTVIAIGLFFTQPITANPAMTIVHIFGAVIAFITPPAIWWNNQRGNP